MIYILVSAFVIIVIIISFLLIRKRKTAKIGLKTSVDSSLVSGSSVSIELSNNSVDLEVIETRQIEAENNLRYITNVKIITDNESGTVFKGTWLGSPVTLKLANDSSSLVTEAKILSKVSNHPNVVQFCGIYKDGLQEYIVTEYVPGDDLSILLQQKGAKMDSLQKVFIAYGIAAGMCHLENQKIAHCNIAGRNILAKQEGNNYVAKLTDFGLSRQKLEESQSIINDTFLIRWIAPEAFEGQFSSKSDVWSFGVTLWEIFSNGRVPYEDINNEELQHFVQAGNRLPTPLHTPPTILDLMTRCWDSSPEERPHFEEILLILEELLTRESTEGASSKNNVSEKTNEYK